MSSTPPFACDNWCLGDVSRQRSQHATLTSVMFSVFPAIPRWCFFLWPALSLCDHNPSVHRIWTLMWNTSSFIWESGQTHSSAHGTFARCMSPTFCRFLSLDLKSSCRKYSKKLHSRGLDAHRFTAKEERLRNRNVQRERRKRNFYQTTQLTDLYTHTDTTHNSRPTFVSCSHETRQQTNFFH